MTVVAFPSFEADAAAQFGVPDLTDSLRSFLVSLTGWTPERVDEVMQAGMQEAALLRDEVSFPSEALTERERTVLSLFAGGFSGPRVAEHLVISPHTVREYAKRIRRKFGVPTIEGAVFLGLVTGQLDFDETSAALSVAVAA